MRLHGKTAIVTGAASGIGRAVSLRLASEGASVLAVDISRPGLAVLAAEAKDKSYTIETKPCDVSAEEDVKSAVSKAINLFGRIDMMANIAGMLITKCVCETSREEYTRMMDVNMGGFFLFTREVLRHMKERRAGVIVNLASELAFVGCPEMAVYSATKGAVTAFSRSVALDAIRYGVRVNCLCPGMTDTPIFWGGASDPDERHKILAQAESEMPIGRLITPDEVAGGVMFMLSDASSACVGASLIMDGGYTIV